MPGLACAESAAFAARVIRRLALLALLPLAVSVARAQAPLALESDQGEVDGRTNEQIFRGHARATDGVVLLTADEIRSTENRETITATGHVVFTRKAVRLLA